MQRWIRSALVLLVSLALAAQAQPAGKRPRPDGQRPRPDGAKFEMPEPDLNGDGAVDDDEAAQYGKARLEQVKKSLETMVKRFDANGDGNLDDEEQARMKNQLAEHGGGRDPMAMLKRFDKDGDFRLSADEEGEAQKAFAAQAKQPRGGRDGQPGREGQAGREGQRGPQPPDPDTNGDGIVDEQEARAEAERRVEMARRQLEMFKERQAQNPDVQMPAFMAAVDTNQDGELNGEEANAIVARVMAEFEERNATVLKIFDENGDGVFNEAEMAVLKKAVRYHQEMQRQTMQRMGVAPGGKDRHEGKPAGDRERPGGKNRERPGGKDRERPQK
ncbi:MAG: hypothetical protein RBU25_01650 [Lentisphaeria bacterium]|jgi:Ca2+-binding EF-hand superfamily protein|nr:hypothetical protein [Lentisphaeria bacterium]